MEIAVRQRALLEPGDHRARQADDRIARARWQLEVGGPHAPAPRPGARRPSVKTRRQGGSGTRPSSRPPAAITLPRAITVERPRRREILEQADVGVAAGRHAAEIGVEPVVGRRVQRGHAVGVDRRHAALERHANQVIDEAVGPDEGGHRAVAGQHQSRGERRRRLERVEQPGEIRAQRRLAQHHRDPLTRAVEHLRRGDRLVVRGEAGRGDRGDLVGRGAGRVALDRGPRGRRRAAAAARDRRARRRASASPRRSRAPADAPSPARASRGSKRRHSPGARLCACGRSIQ